jgi:hypothetical protein
MLALTLLLAAPGLGGTWLSVVHPCPVDTPWLAQAGHGDHGAQSSHEHGSGPGDSSCSCVGACHNGAAALVSIAAGQTTILAAVGWNASPSSPDSDTPVQPRLRWHPPATAPPLA